MKPPPATQDYRYRFPAEIIGHADWLYHVFSLSLRDVDLLLAERGCCVTIRRSTLRSTPTSSTTRTATATPSSRRVPAGRTETEPNLLQRPARTSGWGFRVVRPAWARSLRCNFFHKLTTAHEAKRNSLRASECGEEA